MFRYCVLLAVLAGCAGPNVPLDAVRERFQQPVAAVPDHPRIAEARHRVDAALERAGAAGAWSDPMLVVKREHDSRGFGIAQSIPVGKGAYREAVMTSEVAEAVERYHGVALDVALEIQAARADLYVAGREHEIHLAHVALMKSFLAIAETKYSTGKVSQQDVLEGQSEAARLQVAVLETENRIEEARAALRSLAADPKGAPLEPPGAPPSLEDVEKLAQARRPAILIAELAVARAESAAALASRERWMPDVTAELLYMDFHDETDWAATVGITLPWFGARKSAERAAQLDVAAQRRALETARIEASRDIATTHGRLKAAIRSAELFEKDLVPRSKQTLEVARSNYEKEKIDFLRFLQAEKEFRTLQLEAVAAQGRVEHAWAALERAAGSRIRRTP